MTKMKKKKMTKMKNTKRTESTAFVDKIKKCPNRLFPAKIAL